MRKLVKGLIVLSMLAALVWGGIWFAIAQTVKHQTNAWFEMQGLSGRMAGNDGVRVSGFPVMFRLDLDSPYVANPFIGQSWTAPFARIEVAGLSPVRIMVPLADMHTLLLAGHEVVEITGRDMRGSLELSGLELGLAGFSARAQAVQGAARSGWRVTLGDFALRLSPQADAPAQFDLALLANELRLDAAALAALGVTEQPEGELPGIDRAEIMARLMFDAAPALLGQSDPMLHEVAFDDFRITWGTAELSALGTLAITATGQPEGTLDFRLRDWRKILGAVVALGLLHPDAAITWENALASLEGAAVEGAPALEITLSFRNGRTRLGPFPIGPAPVLWPLAL